MVLTVHLPKHSLDNKRLPSVAEMIRQVCEHGLQSSKWPSATTRLQSFKWNAS